MSAPRAVVPISGQPGPIRRRSTCRGARPESLHAREELWLRTSQYMRFVWEKSGSPSGPTGVRIRGRGTASPFRVPIRTAMPGRTLPPSGATTCQWSPGRLTWRMPGSGGRKGQPTRLTRRSTPLSIRFRTDTVRTGRSEVETAMADVVLGLCRVRCRHTRERLTHSRHPVTSGTGRTQVVHLFANP